MKHGIEAGTWYEFTDNFNMCKVLNILFLKDFFWRDQGMNIVTNPSVNIWSCEHLATDLARCTKKTE
jgi:hypothetical protein